MGVFGTHQIKKNILFVGSHRMLGVGRRTSSNLSSAEIDAALIVLTASNPCPSDCEKAPELAHDEQSIGHGVGLADIRMHHLCAGKQADSLYPENCRALATASFALRHVQSAEYSARKKCSEHTVTKTSATWPFPGAQCHFGVSVAKLNHYPKMRLLCTSLSLPRCPAASMSRPLFPRPHPRRYPPPPRNPLLPRTIAGTGGQLSGKSWPRTSLLPTAPGKTK